jgi:beta-N-acetylhexosaminidase
MSAAADPAAVIFGLSGPVLTAREQQFFADVQPLGFILFARNCETPAQVRALTASLRALLGRDDAPILIDQEGGRVQRLTPPHWRAAPPAAVFGRLAACKGEAAGWEAAWLNARCLAEELADLGITVDCAPVLDVPAADADPIIGDRALAADPAQVADLGKAVCEGLLAGGVTPVIKHIPGHGRATSDSHWHLPVVDATRAELERTDWAPFRALRAMPMAMTAHVIYAAIDDQRPATISPTVVDTVIRGAIGFDGLLISDDLSMRALTGSLAARTTAALDAGCDIALHCNGDFAEMKAVAEACRPLSPSALDRFSRAETLRTQSLQPMATSEVPARPDHLLAEPAA